MAKRNGSPDSSDAGRNRMQFPGGLASPDGARRQSRQRLEEAETEFSRIERRFVAEARESEADMLRRVEQIERQIKETRADTWAIENEARTRDAVLQAQARMETELAARIKQTARESALEVLDRIEEVSNSAMEWADLIGADLSAMMREEASHQVARQIEEVNGLLDALKSEDRAVELLDMTSRYSQGNSA